MTADKDRLLELAGDVPAYAIEEALEAQSDFPEGHWTDGLTEGMASIYRWKMEKALAASLRAIAKGME